METRFARPVFGAPSESEVGVEGRVEAAGNGWHAVVSLVNAEGVVLGTRDVSSADPSCRELDASLTFIVALFVDPNAAANVAELPPAVTKPETPPLEPPEAETPPEKTAAAVKTLPAGAAPWKSWAALGGGIALGVLPEPSPELVLAVGVLPPGGFPLLLRGTLLHEELRGTVGSPEPIAFSLATGGLAACPLHREWPVGELRACAGVDAGILSTRGLSRDTILVRRRAAFAADARAEGVLHLGEHALILAGATLAVPLIRDYFDYERSADSTLVYRQDPVGASFDVAIGVRVP